MISDTANNEVEVLATSSTNPGYQLPAGTSWQPGSLYVIAGAGTSPAAPTNSGSSALSTELNLPEGLAVDHEGNVLVADSGSNLIAVIAISSTNPGYAVSSWSRGDIYAIAGNGSTTPAPTYVGSSAMTIGLNTPDGVAVDPKGNVVIADTFASEIDVALVLRRQPGLHDQFEFKVDRGNLYQVAGGGATSPTDLGVAAQNAALNGPRGVSVDENGNVVFADEQDDEVDLLSVSSNNSGFGSISSWSPGNVYILAGGGSNLPTGDGVSANVLRTRRADGHIN